jgi:hypothetical protein
MYGVLSKGTVAAFPKIDNPPTVKVDVGMNSFKVRVEVIKLDTMRVRDWRELTVRRLVETALGNAVLERNDPSPWKSPDSVPPMTACVEIVLEANRLQSV